MPVGMTLSRDKNPNLGPQTPKTHVSTIQESLQTMEWSLKIKDVSKRESKSLKSLKTLQCVKKEVPNFREGLRSLEPLGDIALPLWSLSPEVSLQWSFPPLLEPQLEPPHPF